MSNKNKTSKQILEKVSCKRKNLQDPKVVDKKNRPKRDESEVVKKNDSLMELEVYKAIDWMKEGKDTTWIKKELCQTKNERTNRVYSPRFVNDIITVAYQLIDLYYKQNLYKIEKVHIARYNNMIVGKLNLNYSEKYPVLALKRPWAMEEIERNDLMDVLTAMRQKETLLGMHRKTFRIILNTQNNTVIKKEKKVRFDINLLTLDEQIELFNLFAKAEKSDNEIHGVVLVPKINKEEEITVVEQTQIVNIERIERYVSKNENNQGSTITDIENKIQQKLLEVAAKQKKR